MGINRPDAGVDEHSGAAVTAAPCRWCGQSHGPMCPWVKAMEFDGYSSNPTDVERITRVEFFSPAELFGPMRKDDVAPTAVDGNYPRLGQVR